MICIRGNEIEIRIAFIQKKEKLVFIVGIKKNIYLSKYDFTIRLSSWITANFKVAYIYDFHSCNGQLPPCLPRVIDDI